MTDKQKIIFEYVRENGSITSAQADDLIGANYHHNSKKYVGEVLSRMVKQGLLQRVKKGNFELDQRTNKKQNPVPENQLNLF